MLHSSNGNQDSVKTQAHWDRGGSTVFLNYAVWESTDQFKQAINNPEFQSSLSNYRPKQPFTSHVHRKWQSLAYV